jgi:uncharacterized protein
MQFEWDEEKNRQNIAKHGLRFEDACRIFNGFTLDREDDRFEYDETRIISLGLLDGIAIVAVAYTDRCGRIRLISARPAVKSERNLYEKALRQALEH